MGQHNNTDTYTLGQHNTDTCTLPHTLANIIHVRFNTDGQYRKRKALFVSPTNIACIISLCYTFNLICVIVRHCGRVDVFFSTIAKLFTFYPSMITMKKRQQNILNREKSPANVL